MSATDAEVHAGQKCERCGETMVCRCGQTEPTPGWPCTHGGCLFECPNHLQQRAGDNGEHR
jgi:hypothetical protein